MTAELVPNGLSKFTIKLTKLPEAQECTLGIQLSGAQSQFLLLKAKLQEDDPYDIPLWTRLSSIVTSHPIRNPDADGHYKFYIKTYSENEGALEALVDAGILSVEPVEPVKQGFVEFPLVKVTIPLRQMAKQCGNCEKWELCSDEKRMRGCSGCHDWSKTWYCDEECQKEHWSQGYPAHKKVCGK
ncbi:hypothetical protein FRB90_005394 [Tulasnella sp. 427]|nr:hypothetical protein FRB90_005394 [Tulasnella sp. 427]